jgi:hypothetical protein
LGNIPGAYVSLDSELIRYIKYHVNPETDKIKIKISGDGSKVSRISNFVVLSFSVITDDLTSSSKDQNVFCIVNCKEDYDHLKLVCKPIFQKINTLYEKASIEVEGKHLDILMGSDMKFLIILQQYCFPHNYGNCYTHIMSLNNVLKKKQLHFQICY